MNEQDVEYAGEETEDATTPCFVRHEDAGGQCERPATMTVHGLNFCEAHGEEARIGASLREHYEAACFFECFDSPHVPPIEGLVGRELEATATRLFGEGPTDEDHSRALEWAYPSEAAPESVRMRVRNWDVGELGPTALDYFLDNLATINTLIRLAHEDRKTWLVELLEVKRQSIAALAVAADDRDKIGSKD